MNTTSSELRPRALAALSLGLLLAATGCGSSSTDAQGGTSATPVAPASSAAATAAPTATASASVATSSVPNTSASSAAPAPASSAAPSAASQAPSVASTPVPAPGGGDINQTIAPSTQATPSPTAVGATVRPVAGAAVSIRTAPVKLAAKLPGDVSGPGIAVTVTIRNTGTKPLPVGETVVSVTKADGSPAPDFVGDPSKPFTGTLAAGRSAQGTYAFRLPENERSKVRIEVRGNPEMGIAVYQGKV